MKKIVLFLYFCLVLTSMDFFAQGLSLMTYNIRLDVASDGPNQWSQRREFLANQVRFFAPGILGIQEGLPNQVAWLDSVLADYDFTGVGRDDGKNEGEFSAIFFRKEHYTMESGSTFWLSETPGIPSKGWDAAIKRICTWAIFRDTDTNARFIVMNTHFDHIGIKAREESARLILLKMREINVEGLPAILMGDFNLEPESEPIKYISMKMNDSREVSPVVFGPEGTFNGFQHDKAVTTRIDYIFTGKKYLEVEKYAVLSDSDHCRYPSDHLPVFVVLKLKP